MPDWPLVDKTDEELEAMSLEARFDYHRRRWTTAATVATDVRRRVGALKNGTDVKLDVENVYSGHSLKGTAEQMLGADWESRLMRFAVEADAIVVRERQAFARAVHAMFPTSDSADPIEVTEMRSGRAICLD